MSECSGSCAVHRQNSLIGMFDNRQYSTNNNTPAIFNDIKMQDGLERYSALKPTICYLA
ncbi:MAG: hypothetical protein K6E29_03420 [Cyanobacteria bacterium RUI128]|nr:hypothetical protein [Cyanobacteria bacterium RUI128]